MHGNLEYAKWHEERRCRILARQEEIRKQMVADGYSDSPQTADEALFQAMKVVDGIAEIDVWNAAWNAAVEVCAKLVDSRYDECEPWLEPYEVRELSVVKDCLTTATEDK